jgi:hypothetical protein
MVRAAVIHRLPAPEAAAVHAIYGVAGQPCKAEGIAAMRDYCLPMLSTQGNDPTLAIAWGVFGEKQQREFLSERKIANEAGLAYATVGRDIRHIQETRRALLNRAIDQLQSMFKQHGLVASETA